ncbi:YheC/YheD family protein [Paenibacillus sp. SI8]|uniref:YheC/YheD family protein n=1 Tax=unclassified Paenibacillus TaxID=185978 RepID=UPI003466B7C3
MRYRSQSIKSKWIKTKWLIKHRKLKKYVPRTELFSNRTLHLMLSAFPTLYFKPTGGTGGAGIIRIKTIDGGYQIQHKSAKSFYTSKKGLYNKLRRFSKNRSFLLQQGIRLATTKGKPFDIRVMVQKRSNGTWESSAIFTKIGKPGTVATNYHQGGKIDYFPQTMAGAGYKNALIRRKKTKLEWLGSAVGNHFDRYKKGFRELGLDVALDVKGAPWILEVNTRPQFYPLKHLKDKRMYRRILSISKQYGRLK